MENRELTSTEINLGRNKDYYLLTPIEQWEEDKKLGILDWDGSEEDSTNYTNEKRKN